MKLKKLVSVLLVGTMLATLGACGSNEKGTESAAKTDSNSTEQEMVSAGEDGITIWTFTEDLKTMAEKYTEDTGVEVVVNIIPTADYPTKLTTAMLGGSCDADIIVGEPQMLDDFFDNGFFANLDDLGAKDYDGKIVDYVWARGKDAEGVQRAISYQITPAGFFYRRDIAKEVFGTEDPTEIGKIFSNYDEIVKAGEKLKAKGYRIFASDSEVSYFSGNEAWVVDGKLNVADCRTEYMDLVVDLYQKDLTAYANQWSTPWYQAMAGEVPILTADIQNYQDDSVNVWDAEQFAEATKDLDTTQVFAFGLPSWGVLTMRDHVGDTAGSWGFCAGPAAGFGGGTYIGIADTSNKKDAAWKFLQWCTLNEDTANWWIEKSQGDAVSLISVLEAHASDENPTYGNQHMYELFLELAKKIDYSKVTRYDQTIGDLWGKAISNIKTGAMTKEEAINDFYDQVESTYAGEIQVER
ncbi:MAG: extracellular solute-binding protein [Agathobacter sp.]|uniref:ABC transporter substrate-binding protein n=1 Tax=Agathobacter sp. TaxID=2021311 RepID=UPI00258F5262|nr:extracellular solute-binding protein [Agathobacter sp.]MCR5678269.1 extracellular solute-binding protein [Agathobacter sp.]